MSAAGFIGLGTTVTDNGMTINNAGAGFGDRVPDIIANLRVDQAWGFAGVSAALHDASCAYYGTPNVVTAIPKTSTGGRWLAARSSTFRAAT